MGSIHDDTERTDRDADERMRRILRPPHAPATPFWLAPIFTPDGQLLYLRRYPSFGDQMQVVDLRTHRLLGPVPTPTKLTDPGPFAWLFPVADAGGTPSTVPVSPDGLHLYMAGDQGGGHMDGITVLRIRDLKPVARLGSGST